MRVALIGALCVLLPTAAFAVDLSIDPNAPIDDLDGKQALYCVDPFGLAIMPNPACKDARPETFKFVAMEALNLDPELKGADKGEAGALAIKLSLATEKMGLTTHDIDLIKRSVPALFNAVTSARMNALLGDVIDPKAK